MNVVFKQLSVGSGVDVWANNLSKELEMNNINSSVLYYSKYYAFFPNLLKLKKTASDFHITHSNISYGFSFKDDFPLVATEHHLVYDPIFWKYTSFSQKAYYKFIFCCEKKTLDIADKITCVSNYTKEKLEEIFEYYDSKVIYNGVDTSLFRPIPVNREKYEIGVNKHILFFAGNLSSRKGADLLPQIMKELGDDFVLLTTSGLGSNFKNHSQNIVTLGRLTLSELVNIYNVCDVFLFPSRLEGFGLAVAEAMSCGKPIVTTNCSSLPELVIDGKGGFLCELDNVKEFANNIKYLVEDENLLKKMGKFNRKRIENNFTVEMMADQYLNIYKKF